jgi:hypothetical protein
MPIIAGQLYYYFEKNGSFFRNELGFRQKKSCEKPGATQAVVE